MGLFDFVDECWDGFCNVVDDAVDIASDVVDIASDFVDLGKELTEITVEAVEEFIDDPIDYTVESAKDAADIAVGIATIPIKPLYNIAEGIVDSCREQVYPIRGSVLYTDLAAGYAEHSGIYIGNDQIIELNSQGDIAIVSPREFISGGTGISIYVSCSDTNPVGSNTVAQRAEEMVGSQRNYNVIWDNCHQFTSGCLTGNFENGSNYLWMVKENCKKQLGSNTWRMWDIELFS